jgi:hypothetical protein
MVLCNVGAPDALQHFSTSGQHAHRIPLLRSSVISKSQTCIFAFAGNARLDLRPCMRRLRGTCAFLKPPRWSPPQKSKGRAQPFLLYLLGKRKHSHLPLRLSQIQGNWASLIGELAIRQAPVHAGNKDGSWDHSASSRCALFTLK